MSGPGDESGGLVRVDPKDLIEKMAAVESSVAGIPEVSRWQLRQLEMCLNSWELGQERTWNHLVDRGKFSAETRQRAFEEWAALRLLLIRLMSENTVIVEGWSPHGV